MNTSWDDYWTAETADLDSRLTSPPPCMIPKPRMEHPEGAWGAIVGQGQVEYIFQEEDYYCSDYE